MPDWITRGSLVFATSDQTWNAVAGELLSWFSLSAQAAGGPVWLALFETDDGSRVEVARDGSADGLAGWSAPPDCVAVSVVATGRVIGPRSPAAPCPIPAPFTVQRLALCCVVARDGAVGWRTDAKGRVTDSAPDEGRVMDCLRRCMGLATPSHTDDPAILIDLIWLGLVIEEGRKRGSVLRWSAVEHLRPTVGGLRAPGSWTWESIRAATACGAWPDGPVPARLAAWMDDGMFARSVLDALPHRDTLLPVAEGYLSAADRWRLRFSISRV
jgi:hypothetical protein